MVGCILVFLKINGFNSSNAKETVTHDVAFVIHSVLIIASVVVLFFGAQNPFIYFNF